MWMKPTFIKIWSRLPLVSRRGTRLGAQHFSSLKNRLNRYGLVILAMVNVSSGIKVLATVTTPLIFCNTWLMGWGFLADIVKPLLCANKRPPWAFSLIQLPSYSPNLNPIEGLWKWMREDLTQHHCYKHLYQLEHTCLAFIERINLDPETIISRLWPKFELDPDYEKVLFSFWLQYNIPFGILCFPFWRILRPNWIHV